MDQNKYGNANPVTGPHEFGGGGIHQATIDGNQKPGNYDYEDMTTETQEVLWEEDYPITFDDIESVREIYDE